MMKRRHGEMKQLAFDYPAIRDNQDFVSDLSDLITC